MSTELVVIEPSNIPAVFADGGLDPILGKIADEAKKLEPNVGTAKGRAEIASMAHKIARSKTYLDGLGKSLVEEEKKRLALVDAERKRMRDYLDNLKDEVRRPLTDWEQAEDDRVNAIKARIEAMRMAPEHSIDLDTMQQSLADIRATAIDDTFAEFANEAATVKDYAIGKLEVKIEAEELRLAQIAELEQLRTQAEENERKRREDEIAARAAQAERERVEAAARAESDRIAREKQVEIDAANRAAAEARIALEQERIAAEQQKQREEAERNRAEAEQAARERDQAHRKAINREAYNCLIEFAGLSDDQAKAVITAIVKGQIKNVSVKY